MTKTQAMFSHVISEPKIRSLDVAELADRTTYNVRHIK